MSEKRKTGVHAGSDSGQNSNGWVPACFWFVFVLYFVPGHVRTRVVLCKRSTYVLWCGFVQIGLVTAVGRCINLKYCSSLCCYRRKWLGSCNRRGKVLHRHIHRILQNAASTCRAHTPGQCVWKHSTLFFFGGGSRLAPPFLASTQELLGCASVIGCGGGEGGRGRGGRKTETKQTFPQPRGPLVIIILHLFHRNAF